MGEELVTIHRFQGSAEANLWKEKLNASGIKANVINDVYTGAATPDFGLQVREKDAKRAHTILKTFKNKRPFKVSWASILIMYIFGIVGVICGIPFLYKSDTIWIGIITIVYGGLFLILPLSGIIKRNKPKR
jgi:hypothetical protein